MSNRVPLYTGALSDAERAVVAGFLLHYRRAFLRALTVLADPAAQAIERWASETTTYYQHAESVTRYLLSEVGYPVAKGKLWEENHDH